MKIPCVLLLQAIKPLKQAGAPAGFPREVPQTARSPVRTPEDRTRTAETTKVRCLASTGSRITEISPCYKTKTVCQTAPKHREHGTTVTPHKLFFFVRRLQAKSPKRIRRPRVQWRSRIPEECLTTGDFDSRLFCLYPFALQQCLGQKQKMKNIVFGPVAGFKGPKHMQKPATCQAIREMQGAPI